MGIEELADRLKKLEVNGIPKGKPMTSHELAKRLLALPDQEITIVKGEGDGYVTEYSAHPGGPWLDAFGKVRVAIECLKNGVAATGR